ncbi:MAG: hypothetical protein WC501_03635 [Candidatus Micrarchaeia archaeon]
MAFKDKTLEQGSNKNEITDYLTNRTAMYAKSQLNPILANAPEPLKKVMKNNDDLLKVIEALNLKGEGGAVIAVCNMLQLPANQREQLEMELRAFFKSNKEKILIIYQNSFKIAIRKAYDSSKTDQERIEILVAGKSLGLSYKVTQEEILQEIAKGKSKPELTKLSNLASMAGYSSDAIRAVTYTRSEFKPDNPINISEIQTQLATMQIYTQKLAQLAKSIKDILDKQEKDKENKEDEE